MGFSEGVGFVSGAENEAGIVGEMGEILETVGVEREVVGDGYVGKL